MRIMVSPFCTLEYTKYDDIYPALNNTTNNTVKHTAPKICGDGSLCIICWVSPNSQHQYVVSNVTRTSHGLV